MRHFFESDNADVQVVSAKSRDHYPGVEMQRTMFLLQDERLDFPSVIDVFRLKSDSEHQYDYPIHHNGQLISTNLEFAANADEQKPLGEKAGYQHIWKTGEGKAGFPFKMTWLDGHRYYSIVTSAAEQTNVIFGRTGANDPNFNLRSEPLFVVRNRAEDFVIAAVIEPHGYFNEAREKSVRARGFIESVRVVGHNDDVTVVEITGKNDLRWTVGVNNDEASRAKSHEANFSGKRYSWTGNYMFERR